MTGPEALTMLHFTLRCVLVSPVQRRQALSVIRPSTSRLASGVRLLFRPTPSGRAAIDCYFVEVQDFTAAASGGADAKRFKLDPARLVYSLRWKHNAHPPDYEMVLIQDEPPQGWVNTANLTLLGELRRRAPEAIDWEQLTAAGVVQMLDAFEAAQESHPVRH